MSKEQSIKKNFVFKLLYQVLSVITPLITAPYAARVLGADGIGTYSYTSSLMAYFTMFAALGSVNYGTREIAQCRDDKHKVSKTFWEIELLTVVTTIVSLLGWLILVHFDKRNELYLMALVPLLLATAADISWLYTGLEMVQYTVVWNMVCKVLGVVFLLLLIKTKDDLVLYIFITSMIQLFGNISMWIYLPKLLESIHVKELHVLKHLKQTFKYFITSVAISVYTILDKTMIGLITKDSFQNGYYEQANKIIGMVKPFAFSAINDVMTPRMSYLFAKEKIEEIKRRINRSLDIELTLSIGATFGIFAVSSSFVPIFFGDGYEPVVQLLQMMSFILIPICVSTCTGSHYYLPSGNVVQGTKLTLVGSVLNLSCNAPLICFFGAKGATVASLLAETVIAVLYMFGCKNYLNLPHIAMSTGKKVLAGCLMLAAVLCVDNIVISNGVVKLATQVAIGMITYLLILIVLKDSSVVEVFALVKERMAKKWQK